MTPSPEDFEAQLRAALELEADDAPRADLSQRALTRARRIRTGRRVRGAVAVAVVCAVAVPIGFGLVDTNTRRAPVAARSIGTTAVSSPRASTAQTSPATAAKPTSAPKQPTASTVPNLPRTLDLTLAALPRGDDPTVPYLDGRTFHAPDGSTTSLDLAGDPYTATVVGDALVGWYYAGAVSNYGSADGLQLAGSRTVIPGAGPVVDVDGAVAWAESDVDQHGNPRGPVTLRYARSLDDIRSVPLGDVSLSGMVAVRNGVAILNAYQGRKSVVLRVDANAAQPQVEQPWPSLASVSAVSPDGSRLAVATNKLVGPNDAPCSAVVAAADLTTLWESCDWFPQTFSPDGSQVLADPVGTEGAGPTGYAVLDAASGEVVREFASPGLFGGEARFEDTGVVDLLLVDDRKAAFVRCTVILDCELATDPVPADDPTMSPYRFAAGP